MERFEPADRSAPQFPRKPKSKLIAKKRLNCSDGIHFVEVFLWHSIRDAIEIQPGGHGLDADVAAFFHACETRVEGRQFRPSGPKIGEIHIAKDAWSLYVVEHELLHAMLWRIQILGPQFGRMMRVEELEEEVCYEFGEWSYQLVRWLIKHNPHPHWETGTGKRFPGVGRSSRPRIRDVIRGGRFRVH